MSSEIISFNGVGVDFPTPDGDFTALTDVTLSIDQGDFICVVGPSGCGKTTLMHTVAGFVKPTRGEVLELSETEGILRVEGPGWHRGVVFQRPALYPWLNVRKNVDFGLKMRGIDKAQRKKLVKEYLTMVRLWEFRKRMPYELSGGMQQRAAIARVLVNEPPILLMDEPFGALDALTREHLQEELKQIWQDTKKTIIFITHSVEEAVFLGTRIVVMGTNPGRIIETVESPFSRNHNHLDARKIKSLPEFIELRESVLKHIWNA